MEDVFYTEYSDKENEKKIYNIEEQKKFEKIKNNAFNEGYLSKAKEFYENEYNKGFKDGENYSLEYGKLLGIIECIQFFSDNVHQLPQLSIETKNDLNQITQELEEFKDKLNKDIIYSFKQRLEDILKKFANDKK